jgi:membrane-bound ClpP family serine protease
MNLLILLLAVGLLLLGAEIFLPGAVIGSVGLVALAAAVWVGFTISPAIGFYVMVGVVLLAALTVALWVGLFPKTGIGRRMTLSQDGRAFKAADPKADLVGKEGVAQSDLRPAGFALVDGQRVDVVTEGELVARGQRVRVVKAEGARVVVRKVESP